MIRAREVALGLVRSYRCQRGFVMILSFVRDLVMRPKVLLGLCCLTACLFVGSGSGFAQQSRPFEMLVVGDSLVWGQGLEEKDKFYTLVAEWLRSEAFRGPREVNLKVKAHSGSTAKFHPDEAEKYKKAGRDETFPFAPEVNVSFPSIYKQVEVAADEYRTASTPGADLILVTGCITDITTSRVYNPKGDDDELRREIQQYCGDDMYDVIERAAELHPNALIAVVGYFPAIGPKSSNKKLLNAWLEALSASGFRKAMLNNPIILPLFFNKLKKRAMERSKIWLEESDKTLKAAVEKLNAKYKTKRAVFIEAPLTLDHATEAPDTKLFRMGKNGIVTDPMAKSRIKDCNDSLPKLKAETGIDFPIRLCEIAAIGHPDPAGARAYFDAIKGVLAKEPALMNVR